MAKSYPGVARLTAGQYMVRGEYTCPKTGRTKTVRRIVEASSVSDAAMQREALLKEVRAVGTKKQRQRLKDYVKQWLNGKLETLAASTADRYLNELTNHIMPAFGEYWIDAITKADLVAWRTKASLTLKPATVNSILRTLKLLVRDAVRELQLSVDPTVGVGAVASSTDGDSESDDVDDGKVLTQDELLRLLDAAEQVVPQWYPLIRLLATSGMRFSEATALKWGDLDFNSKTLRIRRAQVRKVVGKPKTKKSRRTLPIEALTAAVLQVHKTELASRFPDGEWVFPNETGELLFNGVLTKPLRKAAKAAGVPTPSAHWFRRTLNRLLGLVATKRVQQGMMGHVTDRMTERYDHIFVEEKRAAVTRTMTAPNRDPDENPDVLGLEALIRGESGKGDSQ